MKKFKKIALFLAALLFALPLAACGGDGAPAGTEPADGRARVVILAGQSNMEGWSYVSYAERKLSADEYAAYDAGAPNVRIAYARAEAAENGNPFRSVSFGQGVDDLHFGPEIGISRVLGERCPETKFYLVKYAVGGSSMHTDWRPPSSGGTGTLYTAMTEYVTSVLQYLTEQGVDYVVSDFCFMQGEADSGTQTVAAAYADTLKLFMSDVREEFSQWAPEGGIRFIDGLISDSSFWPYYELVNASKRLAAGDDPKNAVLDTLAAGLGYDSEPEGAPDLAHYDALSMLELGKMFGEAIAKE